jgi:hypothetical protein
MVAAFDDAFFSNNAIRSCQMGGRIKRDFVQTKN